MREGACRHCHEHKNALPSTHKWISAPLKSISWVILLAHSDRRQQLGDAGRPFLDKSFPHLICRCSLAHSPSLSLSLSTLPRLQFRSLLLFIGESIPFFFSWWWSTKYFTFAVLLFFFLCFLLEWFIVSLVCLALHLLSLFIAPFVSFSLFFLFVFAGVSDGSFSYQAVSIFVSISFCVFWCGIVLVFSLIFFFSSFFMCVGWKVVLLPNCFYLYFSLFLCIFMWKCLSVLFNFLHIFFILCLLQSVHLYYEEYYTFSSLIHLRLFKIRLSFSFHC